jgi:hypothetical protein
MNSEKNNENLNNNENISSLANTEEIKSKLFINFLKLISKFSSSYFNSIKEWKEFPTINEIKDEIKIKKYLKKLSITISILLNHSKQKKNYQIEKVLNFTNELINSKNLLESISKLTLLVNNGMILIQLNSAKNENEINLIMINYKTTIIKNFRINYNNTFAMLFQIIKDNLSYFNDLKFYFNYEQFFIDENFYLNEILVPQIKKEILMLNNKINNFVNEFEINNINFENDLDLLYLINVLVSLKDLIEFKEKNDEEKFNKFKNEIKEKLFNERKEKLLENEKLQKEKNLNK